MTEAGCERLGVALPQSNLNRERIDATRHAAESILSKGGAVQLYNGPFARYPWVKDQTDLPNEPFEIHGVTFPVDAPIDDDGFAQVSKLSNLVTLDLRGVKIADRGFGRLGGLKRLESLAADRVPITDSDLAELAGCEQLRELALVGTSVGRTGISGLDRLCWLSLSGTGVGDGGRQHLTMLSNLDHLELTRTAVTPEGVKRLQKALPHCHIITDFPQLPVNGDDPKP